LEVKVKNRRTRDAIAVVYPGRLAYHDVMVVSEEHFLFYCRDHLQVENVLAAYVQRHRLLQGVSRLGLAVSGGADSVALFHLLLPLCREAGIRATVLHLNHGLRGESDEEEQFVNALARDAHVPFLSRRAGLASRLPDGRSLEMAARDARMAFFQDSCRQAGLDAVATGHQADDVAETLLLRLARGAGAAGLAGLRPLSKINGFLVIRPLLAISDQALRDWLRERDHSWREDASNRDDSIPRNFVRNILMPQLERAWQPNLRARLCQSAETLREDDNLLEALAEQHCAHVSGSAPTEPGDPLPVSALLHEPIALQRRILRLWLFRHSLTHAAGFDSVQALLARCQEPGDWQCALQGNALAICRGGMLSVQTQRRDGVAIPPATLFAESSQPLRWGDAEIAVTHGYGVFSLENGIGHYPSACTLSETALDGHALLVRSRQPGDRIAPTGMKGSKKIQDLFVDEKVPEHMRDLIPLLICDGEVAWVPGYRVARRFAVPASDAPSVRITVRTAP